MGNQPLPQTTEGWVDKLKVDMYFGEGKDDPSVIQRLDRLEKFAEETVDNSKSTRAMMLTTMCTVLAGIGVAVILHFGGLK